MARFSKRLTRATASCRQVVPATLSPGVRWNTRPYGKDKDRTTLLHGSEEWLVGAAGSVKGFGVTLRHACEYSWWKTNRRSQRPCKKAWKPSLTRSLLRTPE